MTVNLTEVLLSAMSVFLSHAGEQKQIFIDFLYEALREEGVDVFMDESSLRCGDTAWPTILAALHRASVGVSQAAWHVYVGGRWQVHM